MDFRDLLPGPFEVAEQVRRARGVEDVTAVLPGADQRPKLVGLPGGVGKIDSAPFDVEDSIGRAARH